MSDITIRKTSSIAQYFKNLSFFFNGKITKIAIVAVVYIITAKIGQIFAIPPGNVTPLWPPAGIALALFFCLGKEIWPGIFLGAFLGNIDLVAHHSIAAILANGVIGIGATLQAYVGNYFLTKKCISDFPFDKIHDVMIFVFMAGLLGCLVNSTIGSTSLFMFNFIEGAALKRVWLTWWLGDSVGVISFAALLIAFYRTDKYAENFKKHIFSLFLLFLSAVLYLALLVGIYIIACETQYHLLYLLLLVYIFIVLTNGLQAALFVAVISMSWIIYENTKGYTTFHASDPNSSMLYLQLFVACVFITVELLSAMIAERKKAFKDLGILNSELEERVLKRTQDLNEKNILLQESMETAERLSKQLVTLARQAGMSEVANNVLHNIGNALNSVNTTTSLLFERIIKSKVKGLPKASALLQTHMNDLGSFLTEDENGRFFPDYLATLSAHWEEEQKITLEELEKLKDRVGYINRLIAAQQPLSGKTTVEESVSLQTICEEAIIVSGVDTDSYHINVIREYTDLPDIFIDKLKVLQIMANLLSNAKDSLKESSLAHRNIWIRISHIADNQIQIEVTDNGLGIASENMGKIFSQGFTTKELGHGVGLHSSAIAANEMGGTLRVKSDGVNKGATFILTIPKKVAPALKKKR